MVQKQKNAQQQKNRRLHASIRERGRPGAATPLMTKTPAITSVFGN
jgi:hypothetical protein